MPKVFSTEELAEFKAEGAEITLEKREIEVSGLNEVAASFKKIAADKAAGEKVQHAQTLAAIDSLTKAVTDRKEIEVKDLAEILNKLIELQRMALQQKERPEYVFDMKRNSRNYLTQVVAKPQDKKVH